MDASLLTKSQKKAALCAINLIKENCDGALKRRMCADGSVQCTFYTKEEMASPMVATDTLMLSLMIDAFEKHDLVTADVVGAYLQCQDAGFCTVAFDWEQSGHNVSREPPLLSFCHHGRWEAGVTIF